VRRAAYYKTFPRCGQPTGAGAGPLGAGNHKCHEAACQQMHRRLRPRPFIPQNTPFTNILLHREMHEKVLFDAEVTNGK